MFSLSFYIHSPFKGNIQKFFLIKIYERSPNFFYWNTSVFYLYFFTTETVIFKQMLTGIP